MLLPENVVGHSKRIHHTASSVSVLEWTTNLYVLFMYQSTQARIFTANILSHYVLYLGRTCILMEWTGRRIWLHCYSNKGRMMMSSLFSRHLLTRKDKKTEHVDLFTEHSQSSRSTFARCTAQTQSQFTQWMKTSNNVNKRNITELRR